VGPLRPSRAVRCAGARSRPGRPHLDQHDGFKTFKRKLGLLISSPGAKVFYHFDVPGQGLWQIRGRKRIWIYPPTEPFLRATNVENVVRSLDKEDVPYEPWYDEHAEAYDMEPGDMLPTR
jgi:hypothetical protein